jgi:hypothetical protein
MSKLLLAVVGLLGAGLLLKENAKPSHPVFFFESHGKEVVVGAAQEIEFDLRHEKKKMILGKIARLRFSNEIHESRIFLKDRPMVPGAQRLPLHCRMPDGQVYRNIWFLNFSAVYSADSWVIIEQASFQAESRTI